MYANSRSDRSSRLYQENLFRRPSCPQRQRLVHLNRTFVLSIAQHSTAHNTFGAESWWGAVGECGVRATLLFRIPRNLPDPALYWPAGYGRNSSVGKPVGPGSGVPSYIEFNPEFLDICNRIQPPSLKTITRHALPYSHWKTTKLVSVRNRC